MSLARVSSEALVGLKTDLTALSNTLHQIYDLMNADMRNVNAAWQDAKYQEFVEGYKPQIQKCEDISVRYKEWCAKVLDSTIENVIAVEDTDVINGGASSSGGVGVSGAAVGAAVAATATVVGAGAGVAGLFNMGTDSGGNTSTGPSPEALIIANVVKKDKNTTSNSSSDVESWKEEVLKPSTPNPGNEQGAMISEILAEGKANDPATPGAASGDNVLINISSSTNSISENINSTENNQTVINNITENNYTDVNNITENNNIIVNNITEVNNTTVNNTTVNNITVNNTENVCVVNQSQSSSTLDNDASGIQTQTPAQPESYEIKPDPAPGHTPSHSSTLTPSQNPTTEHGSSIRPRDPRSHSHHSGGYRPNGIKKHIRSINAKPISPDSPRDPRNRIISPRRNDRFNK